MTFITLFTFFLFFSHALSLSLYIYGTVYLCHRWTKPSNWYWTQGFYLCRGYNIARGKWGRGEGHVDGPIQDTKVSNDFDKVYIGSSCSLMVIDKVLKWKQIPIVCLYRVFIVQKVTVEQENVSINHFIWNVNIEFIRKDI